MTASSREARRLGLATHWLTLNLLLLALVATFSLSYPIEELSRRLGDAFFRLRSHQQTSPTVAMVVIDDASLERYGRWPWPRAQLARLIVAVSRQRPASIGLDILVSESGDAAGDNDLAQAIGDAGNVILAAKLSNAPDRLWTDPLPLFRARAFGVGHVQAMTDPDGIARRVPLVEVSTDGPRWPLAVEMARVATGQPVRIDDSKLRLGKQHIWIEVMRGTGTVPDGVLTLLNFCSSIFGSSSLQMKLIHLFSQFPQPAFWRATGSTRSGARTCSLALAHPTWAIGFRRL